MDTYVVIGNPVAHSKSPRIHARFAELTGQAMTYGRLELPVDGFAAGVDAARREGLRGANVTVPFKFDAFAYATHRSERAGLAQACNTLRFDADGVWCENTDGIGLVNDIQRNAGVALRGARVLVVGAGGAAAGVVGPLLAEGPRELLVINRTADKAVALAERHAAWAHRHATVVRGGGLDAVDGPFDVVVTGTAASLAGAAIPVPVQALRTGTLAVDMMYGPAAQPFADWARSHGAVPRDGLGMLVEQAVAAFSFWRGVEPPSAPVLAELRAEMGA